MGFINMELDRIGRPPVTPDRVIDTLALAEAPMPRPGRLQALAVVSARRVAALPEVPTVAEAGLPGAESGAWYGILAPKGTPPEIIAALNAAVNEALKSEDLKSQLARQGAEGTAHELDKVLPNQ